MHEQSCVTRHLWQNSTKNYVRTPGKTAVTKFVCNSYAFIGGRENPSVEPDHVAMSQAAEFLKKATQLITTT